MTPKTMTQRSKGSDPNVTTVDVRNPLMADLLISGNSPRKSKTDVSMAGTTDIALITVGSVGAALEFEVTVSFNGGVIGAPIVVTADAGVAGSAAIVPVTSLSDDQLAYMNAATIVCTSTTIPEGSWSVYLVKKAVLG